MIKTYGLKILHNSFLVRSFLYDYVGNSYQDKDLIEAYYLLDKDNNIYNKISGDKLQDSREYIKSIISKADTRYSSKLYLQSVEPLLMVLYPIKHKENTKPKNNDDKQVVTIKSDKPLKKKKHRSNSKEVNIVANCKKLVVGYTSDTTPKLLSKSLFGYKPCSGLNYNQGIVDLNLNNDKKTYTLLLPNIRYKKISISFNGKELLLNDNIKANNLMINSQSGYATLNVESGCVKVKQNDGNVYVSGKTKSLTISNKKGNVVCSLDANYQKNCTVVANNGYINIDYPMYSIRPRIHCLLRKLKTIKGIYQIGFNNVEMFLKVIKNGRIIVR